MVDIPLSADAKITVERRERIVLIGINRPQMFNRIDPEAFYGLAMAYYDFDNDSTLRAAVLFGHGENFSRGNDVEAFSAIRGASADVRYGQNENAHGRVPGTAPVHFIREAGWANSMRYMLTGDYWDAQTAYRMRIVQEVAPNKEAALKIGIDIANTIAGCGPLGIKATLKVAHLGINDSADAAAFAELEAEYVSLFRSEDFIEGRMAEAENRPPIFHGR